MAKTINLGKVGLTFEGDYDSSKNYASRTCVFYNHVSWTSKKDVPAGIAPGTNDEYWQKVSERGAQGIQGERGPQGNSAFDGTGIELVNNLTQGGEAAALSAEQGKILKSELTELESKVNIFLIPSYLYSNNALELANIDTEKMELDLGKDSILVIGNKSYVLSSLMPNLEYRSIPITSSESGAVKILFDTENISFSAIAYYGKISDTQVVLGVVRNDFNTGEFVSANFTFPYTIDGVCSGFNPSLNPMKFGEADMLYLYEVSKNRAYLRFPFAHDYINRLYVKINTGWNFVFLGEQTDEPITSFTGSSYNSGWQTSSVYDINMSESKFIWVGFRKTDDSDFTLAELVDEIEYISVESSSQAPTLNKNEVDKLKSRTDGLVELGKTKGNVSLIASGTTASDRFLPNINSLAMTIDFGGEAVLLVGDKPYILGDSARSVLLYVKDNPTTATKLLFNTSTKKIYAIPYDIELVNDEVLIGGIRLNRQDGALHSVGQVNFPFEYTIDGVDYKERVTELGDSVAKLNAKNQLLCKSNLQFVAHRGVKRNAIPENSLDAFRYAGYCGFDYAECDICSTADGELVVMHDPTINRTMNNKSDYSTITESVRVENKTLQELRDNYVLIANDPRMRREIPTLEEYYVTCKSSGIFPLAELKTSGTTNEHVKKAHDLGCDILGEGNFGFISFSEELLDYARSLSDKTLLLYINDGILDTNNTITGETRASDKSWWCPSYNGYGLTKELVRQYHRAGIKVAVWNIPVSEMDNMMKMDVDCLIGDDLSPNISGLMGVVAKSDIDFSDFVNNGKVENKKLKLSSGQQVSYNAGGVWLGGYYLSIIGKGNYSISAPNLNVEVNDGENDRHIYQGMVGYSSAKFTLTAISDTEIEFIEFSAVEF